MVAEGDLLTIHGRLTGTHEGEFMGIEPTGREVDVPGIASYRVEDGMVSRNGRSSTISVYSSNSVSLNRLESNPLLSGFQRVRR